MKEDRIDDDVYQFFISQIDTVPQMEALLLLWETRPRLWGIAELSQRLYIPANGMEAVLAPLVRRGLVRSVRQSEYDYATTDALDGLMKKVSTAYRHSLVQATTIIHSKASSAMIAAISSVATSRRRRPTSWPSRSAL